MKYRLIHIFSGYISNDDTEKLFLMYQIWQYLADVRLYFFEGEVREGNSLQHTLMKLLEFYIGKLLQ